MTLWMEVEYKVVTTELKYVLVSIPDVDLNEPEKLLEEADKLAKEKMIGVLAKEQLSLQDIKTTTQVNRFYIDKEGAPYLNVPIDRTVIEEFISGDIAVND